VWVASLNGRSAPRQVTPATIDAWKAYLVADGYVIFMADENGAKYVYRVREDGGDLRKVARIDSSGSLFGASPDGKWVIPDSSDLMTWPATVLPVGGGSPMLLCAPCAGSSDVERPGPFGCELVPRREIPLPKYSSRLNLCDTSKTGRDATANT